jgi:nucleoside-diphosphate-sugar epimerase
MKVVVTGNSGLIGKALVPHLLSGSYEVVGIDLVDCEVETMRPHKQYICDINDFEKFNSLLLKENPDYIIHLAARTDLDGKSITDYKTNVSAVNNLVKQTNKIPNLQRIIYTSSMLVCYAGYVPSSDTDYQPTTPYGESKVEGEQMVRSFDHQKVTWLIARPTTVWGPYVNAHYFRFLKILKKGIYFHSGSRPLFKSYSFVKNIAFQYAKLLETDEKKIKGRTFYLADYTPISIREYTTQLAVGIGGRSPITLPLWAAKLLAQTGNLLNAVGLPFPFNTFRLNNILMEYQFDMTELESITGPLPVSFEEGISKTVFWFKKVTS